MHNLYLLLIVSLIRSTLGYLDYFDDQFFWHLSTLDTLIRGSMNVRLCFTLDVTGVGLAMPAVAGGFGAIGGVPLGSSGLFRRGETAGHMPVPQARDPPFVRVGSD